MPIGAPATHDRIRIALRDRLLLDESRIDLHRAWSATTHELQRLRDNPASVDQEYAQLLDATDPGLSPVLTFDPAEDVAAPFIAKGSRPPIAILREQGVNGQVEMAAAFDRAGFAAIDVHMTDILNGRVSLGEFRGFVACGGFSYGDVLGAGEGWAKSILFNARARDEFAAFFAREDTFALGVCNGCQMMSNLSELIPGTAHWPHFVRNRSEQFEARLVLLEVQRSPSLFFRGMEGSRIPVATAHGEGYAEFRRRCPAHRGATAGRVALRGQSRTANGSVSLQCQRLAGRRHRADHSRRPLHDPDAAPRARVSDRADVVASGGLGRGFAVDADVPQCAGVAGLSAGSVGETAGAGRRSALLRRRERGQEMTLTVWAIDGAIPVVDPTAYVHPTAVLIGDVIVGPGCYIGPAACLRGDFGRLEIRAGANVQDTCILHAYPGNETVVEEEGHIGHGAILHGCTVKRNALVGMNAVVNDNAVIGESAVVAALAFVKSDMIVPPRTLVAGIPARVLRLLTDEELAWKAEGTASYRELTRRSFATLRATAPLAAPERDRRRIELPELLPLSARKARLG